MPPSLRLPRRALVRAACLLLVPALTLAGCGRADDSAAPSTSAGADAAGDPAVVETVTGRVRGEVAAGHREFSGIPYAAPPTGPLRFRPPAPAQKWPDVRDATHPGPRCIQNPSADLEFGRQTDEDCLMLNVWTPPVSAEPKPVMVWIHGGAFVNGSGSVYNGSWLASRGDIVVVTVNYRLGTLGFLAHPALGPAGDVGNYGLADQQAALRWVRDNISRFGGDPAKVTVAGESAGGMSVCDHLVAPGSSDLFRAAVVMSAPCQVQADLPTAERASVAYAAGAGCADPVTAADCLRGLPVDELREPVWYTGIGEDRLTGPVTGTQTLPVDPVRTIAEGRALEVPVLIGTTRDEFTLFVALQYLRGVRYPDTEYPALLRDTFGADAAAVAARYPLADYPDAALAYSAAVTDGAFACVTDRMADGLTRSGPVYAYEFNDRDAPAPEPLRTLPFKVGASHSLELRYLFDVGGAPALSADQHRLSDQMIDYWSRFVTTGAPDAVGQPDWPALDGIADPARMSLQPGGSRIVDTFDAEHRCPFWAGLE